MTTSVYRTATGTLTAAQINDLKDTNPLAIPAPAADEYIVVHWAFMFLDHGGTDFIQAAGTDHQALRYTGGVEIDEIGSEAQYTAFIEAAADARAALALTPGHDRKMRDQLQELIREIEERGTGGGDPMY